MSRPYAGGARASRERVQRRGASVSPRRAGVTAADLEPARGAGARRSARRLNSLSCSFSSTARHRHLEVSRKATHRRQGTNGGRCEHRRGVGPPHLRAREARRRASLGAGRVALGLSVAALVMIAVARSGQLPAATSGVEQSASSPRAGGSSGAPSDAASGRRRRRVTNAVDRSSRQRPNEIGAGAGSGPYPFKTRPTGCYQAEI